MIGMWFSGVKLDKPGNTTMATILIILGMELTSDHRIIPLYKEESK